MRVAILTRSGECFPNIISTGLGTMLTELGIENRIFDQAIPMLMRLLPFSEKPKHWTINFHYRLYNKLKHRRDDERLLSELSKFDAIILSECLPNAFWRGYLGVETLKQRTGRPIACYLDAYIDNAPIHQRTWFDAEDFKADRYDFHFCPSAVTELRGAETGNWQAIGIDLSASGLRPVPRKDFTALVDFSQRGYEAYQEQQLRVLSRLGIPTVRLQGRYRIEDIRRLYGEAAVFFLAFPETFGLPIAECLACGTYIFTPQSSWPMAWRLDAATMPWGSGILPDCFRVYGDDADLETQLLTLRAAYDKATSPLKVFQTFRDHYPALYTGDKEALWQSLDKLIRS